jgi:hypothetical protein
MDSKDFPQNWVISTFYSIFKSKIIFSEVRLKRKIVFQLTRHKTWTYYPKKLQVILLDSHNKSHYWILKCICKKVSAIIFWWFKVAWAFQKALCLGGLKSLRRYTFNFSKRRFCNCISGSIVWRFEIRNFKYKKLVLLCLSYLVKIFFGHFKT